MSTRKNYYHVNKESFFYKILEDLDLLNDKYIVFLNGAVGSGKTTFVKSYLSYIGAEIDVTSPTFTIVNEYLSDSKKIYHYDFYRLKDKILKDMLSSLPYTGLEQNGSLTIFYFDRTKFNFPQKHVDIITNGSYRIIPVLRIFDKNRNTLIVVADTPEEYWHRRNSNKVLYVPQHQFSPLIEFSVGGWSMQVALETVDIQAVYEFILPVSEIESLSNVSLKFVNENDLKSFLEPIL